MNNFALKPRVVRKISPKFTSGVTGNHFVTPADFATIYQLSSLCQQGFNGQGKKLWSWGKRCGAKRRAGVRTNSGLSQTTLAPSSMPAIPLLWALIVPPGPATSRNAEASDIDEANLDVEWSGAIAPNATIIFVVGNPVSGGGVFDSMFYAITHSPILAPVISTSYGECEPNAIADGSYSGFYLPLMQQANAEGITVLAPSGDSGAADCESVIPRLTGWRWTCREAFRQSLRWAERNSRKAGMWSASFGLIRLASVLRDAPM